MGPHGQALGDWRPTRTHTAGAGDAGADTTETPASLWDARQLPTRVLIRETHSEAVFWEAQRRAGWRPRGPRGPRREGSRGAPPPQRLSGVPSLAISAAVRCTRYARGEPSARGDAIPTLDSPQPHRGARSQLHSEWTALGSDWLVRIMCPPLAQSPRPRLVVL